MTSCVGVELALDIRDDVHDMAVALDREFLRHLDRTHLRDPPDIVAAEIEQHQMLGAFLLVGQKLRREALVLGLRLAAPACSGDRPDGDFAVAHAHQDFRARTDDLERAEIEVAKKRRRIDPPQRPVERKGGQREGRRKALREDNLKNIARADIILGALDHLEEALLRRVRAGRFRRQSRIRRKGHAQRAFEGGDRGFEPFERAVIGGAKTRRCRPDAKA